MDPSPEALGGRIAELRQRFDASFAAPLRLDAQAETRLLLVRIAGVPHALPLADLIAFGACAAIIALPGQRPECLGISGFRGRSIPVLSLAVLLGLSEPASSRWLAISRDAVGVTVQAFIGQVVVGSEAIRPRESATPALFVHVAGEAYPLVDLKALTRPYQAPLATS